MEHITSFDRQQIEFSSLEEKIDAGNPIRFIDAFVEKLELDKLSFVVNTVKGKGRPSFESALFLKIYLYGYLNGMTRN